MALLLQLNMVAAKLSTGSSITSSKCMVVEIKSRCLGLSTNHNGALWRKPVTTIMLAQVASATLYCKRGNPIPSLPTSKSGDDARDTLANFIRVSGFKVIFVSV